MNKIYKVVWSKVKNAYVVASELAKNKAKAPKSWVLSKTVVAGVLACILSCGAVIPVWANGVDSGVVTSDDGVAYGTIPITTGKGSIAIGTHAVATGNNLSWEDLTRLLAEYNIKKGTADDLSTKVADDVAAKNNAQDEYDAASVAAAAVTAAQQAQAGHQTQLDDYMGQKPGVDNAYNTAKTDYETLYNDFQGRLERIKYIDFSLYADGSEAGYDYDRMATNLKADTEAGTTFNMPVSFYKDYIQNYIRAEGHLRVANTASSDIAYTVSDKYAPSSYHNAYFEENNKYYYLSSSERSSLAKFFNNLGVDASSDNWGYYKNLNINGNIEESRAYSGFVNTLGYNYYMANSIRNTKVFTESERNTWLNNISEICNYNLSQQTEFANLAYTSGIMSLDEKNAYISFYENSLNSDANLVRAAVNCAYYQYMYEQTNDLSWLSLKEQERLNFDNYANDNSGIISASYTDSSAVTALRLLQNISDHNLSFTPYHAMVRWCKENITDIEDATVVALREVTDGLEGQIAEKKRAYDEAAAAKKQVDDEIARLNKKIADLEPSDEDKAKARELEQKQRELENAKNKLANDEAALRQAYQDMLDAQVGEHGSGAVAVGENAWATGKDAVTMGTDAVASGEGSVAIGSGSEALQDGTVSVGSSSLSRRIVNVADGTGATDVATVGQTVELVAGNNVAFNETTNSIGQRKITVNTTFSADGEIADGDTGLISGGTAYTELRPADGNYVRKDSTTAANLKALDDKIGAASVANGTYVKTANTVNANLKALDTQVKSSADAITALDNDKANKDASNVADYAQEWADAIGTGTVTANDTKLVTGKTVYDALHDPNMDLNVHNVTVNNDLKVLGNTELEDTYINGTLEVFGESVFHDKVTMEKSLRVDGNGSFGGDLDVEGNGHFGKDLVVDGTSTLKGDVYMNSNVEIGENLTVKGDSDLQGNTHVGKDLTVDGNTDIGKDLHVAGESRLDGKVTMGSDASVAGDFYVAGSTELHDTVIDGTLEVNKEAVFHDNVKMDKDLRVEGNGSFGGDLDVEGNGHFEKDLVVDGTSTLKGDVYMNSNAEIGKNLTIKGDTDLQGNAHVGKDLTVDGNADIGKDLYVAGNTELDGDLNVGGKAVFEDDVLMKRNLDVDGKATVGSLEVEGNGKVDGNWQVLGNQSVEGNSHIYGNQTVDGNSTLKGDVYMNSNAEIGKDLHVIGESRLDGKVTMGSDASVAGDFTVMGNTVLKDTLVDGALEVNKEATFYDNVKMEKDIWVNGNGSFGGDLNADGNANIGKDLHVVGTSTLDGDVTAGSNMTVKGDTFMEGNADIGENLHVRGTSQLDGNTTIGTEDVPADLYVTGNSNIGKNLTVQGTLDVMDNTHLHKDLQVDGNTNIGGNIYIGGNETVDGDSNVKGNQTVEKNLLVNGDANIKGNGTVGRDLMVGGDINIAGNTIIQQDLTVQGDSNIKGSQLIETNLTVNGDANIHGNGRIDKDFSVGGDAGFEGNAHVYKDLRVDGNANIGGTLVADRVIAGGKDMNAEINRLDGRIDTVGAKSAALAGLRPVDTDADQVVSFSAAYGRFKGENAAALGMFYRPTDSVLVGVGGTVGSSDNMMNASVSFALNKGKNYGMSKANMAKKMAAQDAEIADLKNIVQAMAQKLDSLSLLEGKKAGFPDVPKDHWANKAVETLHGNNMVQGYPDGLFKGNRPMTRYEYAEMLFNALSKGARVEQKHLQEYVPELRQVAANSNNQKLKQQINSLVPVQGAK